MVFRVEHKSVHYLDEIHVRPPYFIVNAFLYLQGACFSWLGS
jgi:hypothetical protein